MADPARSGVDGRPWLRFLARRLGVALVIVVGIAVVNFFLLHLAPGDAADAIAGEAGTGDPEFLAALRRRMGLDQPLPVQLGYFLWRLASLDLGYSHRYGQSVAALILERLPATLLLMATSIALAVAGGVALGVTAARFAHGRLDRAISLAVLFLYATPVFWLGLMMILLFSVKLGWLPTGGMYDVSRGLRGLAHARDVALHLALPALTQAFFFLAVYTRLVRASMLEVLGMDYIRFARAKGLSETRVAFRHALRNALMPLVTMVGMNVGTFLGGAVLGETVFSWPGIGRLMFDAVFQRDLNLLLSILVLSSVFVVLANLAVDILYVVINPNAELR
jgi:peptide/nickel transport system permease protein